MSSFRPDIEGLRAVAILLVILYHAHVPGFTGGYVGVDVFFVLSGYLISSLLVNELVKTGTIDLKNFYARRARRLLPAMAAMLVVTMLVGAVLYAPVEHDGLANTALSTATYVSNFYFTRAATDYLAAPKHTNPLLHTWSLSVEEQFYFVWPVFVMWGAGVWARRLSWPRLSRTMIVGALISFAACLYLTETQQPWAFFLSPPRAWEFALGGITALAISLPKADRARWMRPEVVLGEGPARVVGWLALAGIVITGMVFSDTTIFPGAAAALPAIGTALVLWTTPAVSRGSAAVVLSIPVFQMIGRLSYSWYLWHWPMLVYAGAIKELTLFERVVVALLSLGVAELSYRLVEHPIRHNTRLHARPGFSLALAGGLSLSVAVLAVGWKGAAGQWVELPSQAVFSQIKLDLPEIYRMACDDYWHSAEVKPCTFGPETAAHTLVLLGDSHAGHWFPAVKRMVEARPDWKLVVFTKSACPAVDAAYFFRDIGRVYTECHEWLRGALQRIGEMHPDLVVVTYVDNYPFSGEQWRTGVRNVMESLSRSSGQVVNLRDTPALGFDGPACLARLEWRPSFIPRWSTCRLALPEHRNSETYDIQQAASHDLPNVMSIDMTDVVCPDGKCDVVQGGIVAFRDSAHLSTKFAERLSGQLAERIRAALPSKSSFTL